MRTRIDLGWTVRDERGHYREVEALLLEHFAQDYSPSLQKTLYDVGQACLAKIPTIGHIRLQGFNLHAYLQQDSDRMVVMTLSEEPRGLIMVTINRASSKL